MITSTMISLVVALALYGAVVGYITHDHFTRKP